MTFRFHVHHPCHGSQCIIHNNPFIGVADGEGDGEEEGVGVGDSVGEGVGVGDSVGVGVGVGEGVGVGDSVGDGEGVGDSVDEGDGVGLGLGVELATPVNWISSTCTSKVVEINPVSP
jgi:hypothetical protein